MKIAITGGIGSGKSTVCNIFANLCVGIFDSDKYAKELYTKEHIKNKLIQLFGISVINNGVVDTRFLSNVCFNDESLRIKLVETISDEVFSGYYDFLKSPIYKYVIFESAIIFNHNKENRFDKIISVICDDEEERIRRVMKRSNMNRDEVLSRIKTQLSNDVFINKSDFLIINNGSLDDLIPQVEKINNEIIKYEKI